MPEVIPEQVIGCNDKYCLITVGSTRFDALISALCKDVEQFVLYLSNKGFKRIVFQMGTSVVDLNAFESAASKHNIQVQWFGLSKNFLPIVESASLVISHAGAGSIIETLRMSDAQLIAVINPSLMDNHQAELAQELQDNSYLFSATPETVVDILQTADWSSRKPYPPPANNAFLALVAQTINYTPPASSKPKED